MRKINHITNNDNSNEICIDCDLNNLKMIRDNPVYSKWKNILNDIITIRSKSPKEYLESGDLVLTGEEAKKYHSLFAKLDIEFWELYLNIKVSAIIGSL